MTEPTPAEHVMERATTARRRNGSHADEMPMRRTSAEPAAAASSFSSLANNDSPLHAAMASTTAVTNLMEEAAGSFRDAFMGPGAGIQEACGTLMAGMMRNTQHLVEGLWALHTPRDALDLQQRMLRQWLDTAFASQDLLLRAATQAAGAGMQQPHR
jgi:hypothetical protein